MHISSYRMGLLVSLMVSGQAMALCEMGTKSTCIINGKPGIRTCTGAGLSPCVPTTSTGSSSSGTLTLKYLVLTVLYSPPGTNGGHSNSQVSYQDASTTGTTTTNASSFKSDYSVSASLGIGASGSSGGGGDTFNLGGSFDVTKDNTQTSALDVKKTATQTLTVPGPSADGIDHNRDEIWLWLQPTVDITVTGKKVLWSFPVPAQPNIQYFDVGWLKDPSTMPPTQAAAMRASGITPADYPQILAADPLAGCAQQVNALMEKAATSEKMSNISTGLPCITPLPASPRYVSTNESLPYEPPFSASDSATTSSYKLDTSTVTTNTAQAQVSYKIGITSGFDLSFLSIFKASLKTDDSWTWTDTSTNTTSSGAEQSATATVGGPAFGYKGPDDQMEIWFDTVYKSFVFVPVTVPTDALRGTVTAKAGSPAGGALVTALSNGITYRTYTDSRGQYRFSQAFSGPVQITVGSTTQTLPKVDPTKAADFRLLK